MTRALEAFEAGSCPAAREQAGLAAAILEELAADARWEAALAQSRGMLERLAGEALDEHREGRTETLDRDVR